MDPATGILLLSLLIGAGAASYVGVAPHDRTYRASRGALGAGYAGLASGRSTAGRVFSRPPARSPGGSSIGRDVGWGLRQLWGGVRVTGSFFGALRPGYRQASNVAGAYRTQHPRTPILDHLRRWSRVQVRLPLPARAPGWLAGVNGTGAGVAWQRLVNRTTRGRAAVVGAAGGAGMFDRLPTAVQNRLAAIRRAGVTPATTAPTSGGTPPSTTSPVPSAAAPTESRGGNMTATADVPGLSVVTEFTNPSSMEPALEELGILAQQILTAQAALAEGLQDFVNGYAEAGFTTASLNETVMGLVETIDDQGQVHIPSFAERLPAVSEAIAEAQTLGEHGSQIEADGEVAAFKEQ
jgi:hypothetical protein